jgi:hypothetical protein
MSDKQRETFQDLTNRMSALTDDWYDYWNKYSNVGTWQFWVALALLVVPLVVFVIMGDRKKAFRIGFYGLNIHMITTYIDLFATTHRMWEYPYRVLPFLPASVSLDASLIPVTYILVYQWTLKNNKNYYLYMGILSLAFAFLFKPLLSWLELIQLVESSYITLFVFYVIVGLLGKWLTDLFEYAQDRSGKQEFKRT